MKFLKFHFLVFFGCCAASAESDVPGLLIDLNGDGAAERITWRKFAATEFDGNFYQLRVSSPETGALIWEGPKVPDAVDPLTFGEWDIGISLPQAVGDIDGDGKIELLAPGPVSDVSPVPFRILRWTEKGFVPVRSASLIERPGESGLFAWIRVETEPEEKEITWISAFETPPGKEPGNFQVKVSRHNRTTGQVLLGEAIVTPEKQGFRIVKWLEPLNEAKKAEKMELSLRLQLTEREFDPASPKGQLSCVLENRGTQPVKAPTRYDGDHLALFGQAGQPFPLQWHDRTRNPDALDWIEVKPGSSRKLFEFSLADLFKIREPKQFTLDYEAGRPVFAWDWIAHPQPPPTPIHRGRDGGMVGAVRLWVTFRDEAGSTSRSEELELLIKKSAPEKAAEPAGSGESSFVDPVVQGNTKFACDLYHELSRERGNLFVSPYSISSALAMTYGGAKGATADQMREVLSFRFNNDDNPSS